MNSTDSLIEEMTDGELPWAAEFREDNPKGISVNSAEGLGQIYEDGIDVHMLLSAFLLDSSRRKDCRW